MAGSNPRVRDPERKTKTLDAATELIGTRGSSFVSMAGQRRSAAFDVAEAMWEPVYLSRDDREGPRAFAEKRSPRWEGQ